jgi:hypothetical protein
VSSTATIEQDKNITMGLNLEELIDDMRYNMSCAKSDWERAKYFADKNPTDENKADVKRAADIFNALQSCHFDLNTLIESVEDDE